ncbi:hypothetical protein KC992_03285 [Candidatus Saccharibacteria bacterium]|nr:hypothetical protein [Candidatus Saccharibacteria bacterium]MCA9328557.1 hypothetical protein [Candidatus Saccharibacteria bacterium]
MANKTSDDVVQASDNSQNVSNTEVTDNVDRASNESAEQIVAENSGTDSTEKGKRKLKLPKFSWKMLVMALLLLCAIGAAGFFWNDAREAKQQTPEGVAARNQQETQEVVASLSAQLLIEGDAKPTVARVENPDVLKKANQDFYKNVQTGDYLVLYPQRAIIYRKEEKKIINIAPIINTSDIQSQSADQQQDAGGAPTEE